VSANCPWTIRRQSVNSFSCRRDVLLSSGNAIGHTGILEYSTFDISYLITKYLSMHFSRSIKNIDTQYKKLLVSPLAGPDSSIWIPESLWLPRRETLWFDEADRNCPQPVRVDQMYVVPEHL